MKSRLTFVLLFFSVFACAPAVVVVKPPDLPPQYMIDKVPQFYQGRNECGPTAMSMVLTYWGVGHNKEELKKDLNWHPEYGVSPQKVRNFPYAKYGLTAEITEGGTIERIIEHINQGRPIIVRQWYNYDSMTRRGLPHYRVVIGYNHNREELYIRDPQNLPGAPSKLKYNIFYELWDIKEDRVSRVSATRNSMVVLMPKRE